MIQRMRKSTVRPPEKLCPIGTCMLVLGGAWTPNSSGICRKATAAAAS